MSVWTLRARGADLSRGVIFDDWAGVLTERWNYPDTLQVTGRYADLAVLDPSAPQMMGVVLTDDVQTRFSGILDTFQRSGDGTVACTYRSDDQWMWDRSNYPTPANAWAAQTVDYGDKVTGVTAEAAIRHYVIGNLGTGARPERQLAGLTVGGNQGLGDQTLLTKTSRLDILGQLVHDLAEPAGLTVNILESGTHLALTITAAPDLTGNARYGSGTYGGPGLVDIGWSYTIARPLITAALVAGGARARPAPGQNCPALPWSPRGAGLSSSSTNGKPPTRRNLRRPRPMRSPQRPGPLRATRPGRSPSRPPSWTPPRRYALGLTCQPARWCTWTSAAMAPTSGCDSSRPLSPRSPGRRR